MRIVLGMLVGRAELALEEPSGVKPKRRGPTVGPGGELRMRPVGWR
jgi:hypothetical protein